MLMNLSVQLNILGPSRIVEYSLYSTKKVSTTTFEIYFTGKNKSDKSCVYKQYRSIMIYTYETVCVLHLDLMRIKK